jgi:hypothetical protein
VQNHGVSPEGSPAIAAACVPDWASKLKLCAIDLNSIEDPKGWLTDQALNVSMCIITEAFGLQYQEPAVDKWRMFQTATEQVYQFHHVEDNHWVLSRNVNGKAERQLLLFDSKHGFAASAGCSLFESQFRGQVGHHAGSSLKASQRQRLRLACHC